ncbi:helix-turn-helix transcriptional regulator [Eubacteriales bacterium OttesenSCG-928-N13]|nr:helix-turn-helix transcriptional regulator [Eubacteriales bacterium OttesenSCG-928-N13]
MQAAQTNPLHASRERTAYEIYVSPEALSDYESGLTVPGCDVVQKMVEAYGNHDLRGDHIRAHCPLLPDYGGQQSHLSQAALGWAVAFQSAQEVALQFAKVARDGRITRDEIDPACAIRAKALEVKTVMEESITAIDNALAQMKREG